jgi:hypothetical protein
MLSRPESCASMPAPSDSSVDVRPAIATEPSSGA